MKTYANLRTKPLGAICACCGVSERFAKQFQTLPIMARFAGKYSAPVLRNSRRQRVIAKILGQCQRD